VIYEVWVLKEPKVNRVIQAGLDLWAFRELPALLVLQARKEVQDDQVVQLEHKAMTESQALKEAPEPKEL
jgi:hypothetical protein